MLTPLTVFVGESSRVILQIRRRRFVPEVSSDIEWKSPEKSQWGRTGNYIRILHGRWFVPHSTTRSIAHTPFPPRLVDHLPCWNGSMVASSSA